MVTLHNGDMLTLFDTVSDGTVSFLFADLPYYTTSIAFDTTNQRIDPQMFWKHVKRVLKPNGVACIMSGGLNSGHYGIDIVKNATLPYRYTWFWDKKRGANMTTVKKKPFFVIEPIDVFYARQPTYNPQMVKRDVPIFASGTTKLPTSLTGVVQTVPIKRPKKQYDYAYPRNLLTIPRVSEKGMHPTGKPIALLDYLIRTYTNEGDIVLDPCFGGGSTIKAALLLKRPVIGFEKDSYWYRKLSEHLEEHYGNR